MMYDMRRLEKPEIVKERPDLRTGGRFTRHAQTSLLALGLISSGLFSFASRAGMAGSSSPQAQNKTVVFAVSAESAEGSMDAVVIVDGKQLRAPYTDEQKNARKKFGDEYFATGRQYRLMFGGGDAGTVTVKKWSEGCNNIHADVAP